MSTTSLTPQPGWGGKDHRKFWVALCVAIGVIGLTWWLYREYAPRLIEAMYNGDSLSFLNDMLRGRKKYTLEYYLDRGDKYFNKLLLFELAVGVLLVTAYLPIRLPQRIWQTLRDFFSVTAHPVSLAVFRIAFFILLLFFAVDWAGGGYDAANVLWWSAFPKELVIPPPGLGWLLAIMPINVTLASILSKLFIVVCITGIFGLFSRTSAWIAVICGFYVMGIPQFFGKVHHYQHLLWFAAILAFSPCGDVLSIDSMIRAWRRAKNGVIAPPDADQRYAVPLRMTWLLLGLVYFFPGYWKLWESGLRWAFSDNLRNQLYIKWFQLGNNWRPITDAIIPFDAHPWLYQPAAFITLMMEVGFIFCLFVPVLRIIALILGQLFHTMTYVLMGIPFFDVQACYVVFFDWNRIFHHIGRWLFGASIFVIYDGSALGCRRIVGVLRTMDVLGRINYIDSQDKAALSAHGLSWLDDRKTQGEVMVIQPMSQGQPLVASALDNITALRTVIRRMPAFWLLLPLLYLPFAGRLTASWYGRVVREHSEENNLLQSVQSDLREAPSTRLMPVMAFGIFLFVINAFMGFAHIHSWPFSSYPTFQQMSNGESISITLRLTTADQKTVVVDNEVFLQNFTPDRFFPIVGRVIEEGEYSGNLERRDAKLWALWRVIQQSNPELQKLEVERIQFFKTTYITIPDRLHENPLREELLADVHL